jgi:hypothetical protein
MKSHSKVKIREFMKSLVKVEIWQLAARAGDEQLMCDTIDCDQIADSIALLFHSDGAISLRPYCHQHETELRRLRPAHGKAVVDHRSDGEPPVEMRGAFRKWKTSSP